MVEHDRDCEAQAGAEFPDERPGDLDAEVPGVVPARATIEQADDLIEPDALVLSVASVDDDGVVIGEDVLS